MIPIIIQEPIYFSDPFSQDDKKAGMRCAADLYTQKPPRTELISGSLALVDMVLGGREEQPINRTVGRLQSRPTHSALEDEPKSFSVDLDLHWPGFGTLLDRYFQHAILIAGMNQVVARVLGQLETPANRTVITL